MWMAMHCFRRITSLSQNFTRNCIEPLARMRRRAVGHSVLAIFHVFYVSLIAEGNLNISTMRVIRSPWFTRGWLIALGRKLVLLLPVTYAPLNLLRYAGALS